MSLDILLEEEQGIEIQRVSDPKGILTKLFDITSEGLLLLKYVDPYGDTIFNHMQLDDVLRDIGYLESKTTDRETLELLSQLRTLVLRAKQEIHVYIKFYGD